MTSSISELGFNPNDNFQWLREGFSRLGGHIIVVWNAQSVRIEITCNGHSYFVDRKMVRVSDVRRSEFTSHKLEPNPDDEPRRLTSVQMDDVGKIFEAGATESFTTVDDAEKVFRFLFAAVIGDFKYS